MRKFDQRGWMSFGGSRYVTVVEDLMPFRPHRATAQYLDRLLDPAAFLAPTALERGEQLLAKLRGKHAAAAKKEWAAELKTGFPDFAVLMQGLFNGSIDIALGKTRIDALEHAIQFEDGPQKLAMSNLLYSYLQRHLECRDSLARALELMPVALEMGKEYPVIFHNAACIYSVGKQYAKALECVKLAQKYQYDDLDKLLDDDDLIPMRALPAFKRLRAKAGLR
jgi:hypothetical protein